MSSHRHHSSAALAGTSAGSGGGQASEADNLARAIARLARMVDDVVECLETSATIAPLSDVVAECNAALERCLETQRGSRIRESSVTARDELERLASLLRVVDPRDAAIVMRQIRRVLGRLTSCGA